MTIAGTLGFGVGACYEKHGFRGVDGYDELGHDNYGNYITDNGSIMVFIPAYYYRIGHPESPNYLKYGINAVDIVYTKTKGYVLHRAFIDGGKPKSGFFIDKYLASKDGNDGCKSVFGAEPIILSEYAENVVDVNLSAECASKGMLSGVCVGSNIDAILLSRSRGEGIFQCASIFQYAALDLLTLAHAQSSTNNDYNAWYDPEEVTNYPKGFNNDHMRYNADYSAIYEISAYNIPKCGAIKNFSKTTHNGQMSGVADLNGFLHQKMTGMVTSSDDSSYVYVLKDSVHIASMTSYDNTETGFWGTSANLMRYGKYDQYNWSDLMPERNQRYTKIVRLKNGTNKIFSESMEGIGYIKTCCALPDSVDSYEDKTTDIGINCYILGDDEDSINLFPNTGSDFRFPANGGIFNKNFMTTCGKCCIMREGFRVAAYEN